ncbi:P-loop containing nucleoside triphosphate hydrolase protein [Lentinus tigrinus ALCF2SS1-7]|uniref:P-loop containing nucleoside triphosphate hydrolase protein n=1 Tax=Lentinus tigrinus ALCF2SS1-6 TaxID=1328759 RepID=A0A5C2RYT2_9APHY|nr:P-loop containing nucleoside triphosphate hydrolase protein [Lentinus tigrinus ALCF2SS1-6]RPD71014.1 P-loop containing nucleoside triphosphate hydrolase protein [Lentinus tigrinus ALCF2SS1-7]
MPDSNSLHQDLKVSSDDAKSASPKTHIKRSRLGVWDFYEEIEVDRPRFALAPMLSKLKELVDCFPYLVRMFKDVFSIPGCPPLVLIFAMAHLADAFVPAVTIWFQGQLLSITQTAIETRTVDKERLIRIAAGRLACTVAAFFFDRIMRIVGRPLNAHIRRWWALHCFHAYARLDNATYDKTEVRRQLRDTTDDYYGQSVIWRTIELVSDIVTLITRSVAQTLVLVQVLRGQPDGPMLAVLTLSAEVLVCVAQMPIFRPARIWLAKTVDHDFIKMKGWKDAVRGGWYRKEFVVGNLKEHAYSEFKKASERIGDKDTDWSEWEDLIDWPLPSIWHAFHQPLAQLPQIIFTLRAAQYPMSIPVSLASLSLVQNAASNFVWSFHTMIYRMRRIEHQLTAVKKVYEVAKIPNVIPDGTIPFPEEASQIRSGVALEFRNVSFKYPDAEKYALRNISFSVEPGQLCVIVGSNGSGKSTILKLATRLYDPEEGEIFFGGHDIRTLKLYDLRQAISVLFQDYTLFPLSIRDNIAMGDPATAHDDDRVRLAARLAGAESFVDKLPDGFNTYLEPPVSTEYSSIPEGQTFFTGRKVNYNGLREAAGVKSTEAAALSGGQMQRLAVARTYMRSVVQEDSEVGLLLFDEPSAALDPAAEHDLFDRLRKLRGNKTMVFSTHRFGNLTKHADLILYMDESGIVESGTHEVLLKRDGEYAKLWKLQAQAFI